MITTFTLYGFFIGLIGTAAGLFFGLKVAQNLDAVVGALSRLTGIRLLDPNIYRFKEIPVLLDTGSITTMLCCSLAMSLIAAFLPALKAGFMSPVKCLRSE
jgi:lipoprotein-releasing system permease protein